MSNSSVPGQDWHFVGPDLDPNCFAKVISRQQKLALADNEEIMIILLHNVSACQL